MSDAKVIQSFLDELQSFYQKFASDPESGEAPMPPNVATPSKIAAHAQRQLKAQWPETADGVVARCHFDDADHRAVVDFFRADTGTPIRTTSELMAILSPLRTSFTITQLKTED